MSFSKTIIHAELLYDGKRKSTDATIVVENGKIVDVSKKKYKSGIIGIVTPAFIDPHSHIGMERQGEPKEESEVDDTLKTITPMQNPVDSIYFDDRAFTEAVDFGVLYSCVIPGSGNLIGGKAITIRNFALNRNGAVVDDFGFKMALGYNPRAGYKSKPGRHNTRMGNASLLEKEFSKVLRKEKQAKIKKEKALFHLHSELNGKKFSNQEMLQNKAWINDEYKLALSAEEWALFELLTVQKTIKVHVHKEDDALYLIDLKKKYNLKITAEHASSIHNVEIFRELLKNDIPVVYGPMSSLDYKVELHKASYKNVIPLMDSGVQFGLMTDHPVVLAHHLRDSLKYFLIQEMSPEKAISLITFENARILNLEDRLGTIETGKDASLIVWNQDPFHLGAFPILVMAEGNIIRN
ncbi:MAG: amidohydrolase family protein [Desulfobacula sp.]|jgi:imidazolonepropionase-like amidohydrolase|uniref:amidohydrolase family protein n=1 Tax=Desulfobacula sp. TaxID=2593537 RepID=UPI001D3A5F20|nr:amidohydrolase family protein [Desulfobacula sp.]MBT3484461.1 amidohydrolase family protein [Desulfobacula sp.]MBT3803099.1 amidohydrolase family protein [Desulfobacula sp.]MBT4024669.1 amidohydrolase family protein [Desulfobacula sp.]MBT4197147.1 amidohydrolase family protein [Desulfobacula sp.]